MPDTRVEMKTAMNIGGPVVQITKARGGRVYELGRVKGKPKVPSVTSIVDGTLRNYGLEIWKRQHIERGLEAQRGEQLSGRAIDRIMTASSDEAQASADLGTQMHSIIEGLLQGEEMAVPEQLEPAVQGWLKWRTEFSHWELQGTEVTVFDEALGYAGTVDALWWDARERRYIVVDWKTSAGMYPSALMQVSAYAHALEEMMFGPDENFKIIQRPTQAWAGRRPAARRVHGMVVRFDNGYPLVDGQKDRSQPQVFTDGVESAWGDDRGWAAFESCLALNKAGKEKIKQEWL